MVQETPTLLSLADFGHITGIHPLHLQQVNLIGTGGGINLQRNACDGVIFQNEWQNSDAVGRNEIALAIRLAEETIRQHIGYSLLPDWEVDERQDIPRPNRPELVNFTGFGPRGYRNTMQLDQAYFCAGGIRGVTAVSLGAAIVWSDTDGDGYKETGTVTVATTVTDPEEVALYYPGQLADESYRIRPITVNITGGSAFCRFRRELTVLPSLVEAFLPAPVDGSVDGNFLGTVDVYRVFNDPSQQAGFLWENTGSCCGSASCVASGYGTQTGSLTARDSRLSIVAFAPGAWDTASSSFLSASFGGCRQPDQARVWYRAGFRDKAKKYPFLQMSDDWARTVAILASAYLDRIPCACGAPWFKRWQVDLAAVSGADEIELYAHSSGDLDNPIGTRRGMVYAWKRCSQFTLSAGVGAIVAR